MSIQVTGKNIQVGEAFQGYVAEKLDAAIGKYVGEHLSAHVRVEKERGKFLTNCSVRLRTGLLLEAAGQGSDAYASADNAFERLEKRLRRYKRRLTSHHHGNSAGRQAVPELSVNDFVVAVAEDNEHSETSAISSTEDGAADHPVVIAETARTVRQLPVSEAVMQLDLTDDAFLVFRNAANGAINVVYRRNDGNIGWIDPGTMRNIGANGTDSADSATSE